MKGWVHEFGAEYCVPVAVTDAVSAGKLADLSWCNDACPSFVPTAYADCFDSDAHPCLWVNHPDGNEIWKHRFVVTQGESTLETDDVQHALNYVLMTPRSYRVSVRYADTERVASVFAYSRRLAVRIALAKHEGTPLGIVCLETDSQGCYLLEKHELRVLGKELQLCEITATALLASKARS